MAWLTPEAAAAAKVCRRFSIPENFIPYFMGAIFELARADQWEEFGTLTADEAAEAFRAVVEEYAEGCLIGVTFAYITETPPAGSLALEGGTYNDADYPALAAVIDPTWDNGNGTFTLPDLRGRAVIGAGQGTGLTNRAVGATVGTETVALGVQHMPEHSHLYTKPVAAASNVLGELPGIGLGTDANSYVGNRGGNQAHANMQPSLALKMAVWYQ